MLAVLALLSQDDFMGEFAIDVGDFETGKQVQYSFKLEPAAKRSKKKRTENVSGSLTLLIAKVAE